MYPIQKSSEKRGTLPLLSIHVKGKSIFCGPNNIFTILSQYQTGECYCPTSDIATWAITHPVLCSRGIVKTLFAAQKILFSFFIVLPIYFTKGSCLSKKSLKNYGIFLSW